MLNCCAYSLENLGRDLSPWLLSYFSGWAISASFNALILRKVEMYLLNYMFLQI